MRAGRLFPVHGDWYEWTQEPALSATVFVRVIGSPGGRLILGGLRIDGEPSAELLRAIPVGRIEAAANAQLTFVDTILVPVATLNGVPSRPHWPGTVQAPAPSPALTGWETTEPAFAANRPGVQDSALDPDTRRGRPDQFYREVATAYLELAQITPRPAADLAHSHDVPQTTAHRWIKEARRRGFLPPGRPGKAG